MLFAAPLFAAAALFAAPEAKALAYESLFDDTKVHAIHLAIPAEEYPKLDEGDPLKYVKASADIDGDKIEEIGVRRDGATSHKIGSPKTDYRLSFGHYVKTRRFRGLRRLALDASPEDPTMIREKLAYDLLRAASCPASRAAHAKVFLTVPGQMEDAYVGLYTIVEPVGMDFLDERFKGHQGNLYEIKGWVDIFAPGVENGESLKTVRLHTEKKSAQHKNDRTHLGALLTKVGAGQDFSAALNVDVFLRCLAVNTLLVNLDSYAATGQNYYLYDDPKTKRFVYLPWDMDQSFGQLQFGMAEAMLNWDIFDPEVGGRVLIRRTLAVEANQKKYLEITRTLIDGPFSLQAMTERIDRLHKLIRPAVELDKNKKYPIEIFDRAMTSDIPVTSKSPFYRLSFGLKAFVERRVAAVRDQLSGRSRGAKLFREEMLPQQRPMPIPDVKR